jgi:hypothetical protein
MSDGVVSTLCAVVDCDYLELHRQWSFGWIRMLGGAVGYYYLLYTARKLSTLWL